MKTPISRIVLGPWMFLIMAAPVFGFAVAQLALGQWLDGAVNLLVAVTFVIIAFARASTLRTGLRMGYEVGVEVGQQKARDAMYCSLREAQARGMTPLEWLETELERDRRSERRG